MRLFKEYINEEYGGYKIQFHSITDTYGNKRVVAIIGNTRIGAEGKTKLEAFNEAKIIIKGLKVKC